MRRIGDLSTLTPVERLSEVASILEAIQESAGKVGSLVGEIAAATNEQAQGIDQVNTSVTQMDKVTQQNAAGAEESASASEEMNAQAEQLRDYVEDLVMLVTGKRELKGQTMGHAPAAGKLSAPARAKTGLAPKKLGPARQEVRPDQVIPFDEEDDFKDF